jgi:hypothetical protein
MAVSKTKKLLQSKTFYVAVIQAIIGIVVVFTSTYPELQAVGGVAVAKSILDILLRTLTSMPIK